MAAVSTEYKNPYSEGAVEEGKEDLSHYILGNFSYIWALGKLHEQLLLQDPKKTNHNICHIVLFYLTNTCEEFSMCQTL